MCSCSFNRLFDDNFRLSCTDQGVKIEGIESTLTEVIDAQGTVGLKEDVRNGYEKIKVTFKVTSNAPEEKIKEIIEFAQKRSPVFDIISNPTPVDVSSQE